MPSFLPLWDRTSEGSPYNPGTNTLPTNCPTEGQCATDENESPANQPTPGYDFGSDGSQPLIQIEGEAPPGATATDNASAPPPTTTADLAETQHGDAGGWPRTASLIDALPKIETNSPAKEQISDMGGTRSQVPTSVLSVSSKPSRPSLTQAAPPHIPYAGPGRPEGPGLFRSSTREESDHFQPFLTNQVQAVQHPQIRRRRGVAVHNVDAGNLFGMPRHQVERADSSALLTSESSTASESPSEHDPTTQARNTEGGVVSSLQGPQDESTEALNSGASSVYSATPLLQLGDTHVCENAAGNTAAPQVEQLDSPESQTTGASSAHDGSSLLQPVFKAKSTWPAFESTPAYSNDLSCPSMSFELSHSERLPGAYPSTDSPNSDEELGSTGKEPATNAPESAAKQENMNASSSTPSHIQDTSKPLEPSPNAWYSTTEDGPNPYSFTVTWYAPESEFEARSQYYDAHSTLSRSLPQSEPEPYAPLLATAALGQTSPSSKESADNQETAKGASENQSSELDRGKSSAPTRNDDELNIDESNPIECPRDEITLTNQVYVEEDSPSVISETLQGRSD
ncbi:hypothetical protein BO83DRAFT_389586 [Aspergillus eucalypticola CBS 122712]|uniref:Uncharacterized protein n=1 Tax=Aspergillus eucalypticola (strain CBS 122712 / IBT 29274) TaxID=1448314 RepID=A0A317VDD9_ASPEC|nr:uncharacterized protein BO83DRAFT_389586 [Aspergillus eucalypticola CBS 122712]PWY71281.1 hypothetical protein BO83DRAFT_389586 [Aspergillus eucalypticola CBS 122712]